MDRFHAALHASEDRRHSQGQNLADDDDSGRRDQPRFNQDGRVGERAVLTTLRRKLGRRHHVVVGRSKLQNRQQGREYRAHQSDRRSPLAQQRRQGRCREVQSATSAAKALTYFKFRFLRRPQKQK